MEFAVVFNVIFIPVNKREALQSVGIHSYLYNKQLAMSLALYGAILHGYVIVCNWHAAKS